MATVSDVLATNVGGAAILVANRWVQLKNNQTPFTAYTSSTATDANGRYSVAGVTPGTYSVYVGTSASGPWTLTAETNYRVNYTAGDDIVGNSFTATSGPYVSYAQPGTVGNIWFLPAPRGGILDDSANMQAVIDACSAAGGGDVYGWGNYKANIVLKQGVRLIGPAVTRTPSGVSWTTDSFLITAFATGYVIDTPATSIVSCGVEGVGTQGLGAGTAGGGLRFRNVTRGFVKSYTANNFADEGLLAASTGVANTFEDIFVQNCVLNRTRSAVIGAVDIDGSDHYLNRIEATVSSTSTVSSASLWCVGIAIRGANHMANAIVGEISDVGIRVIGTQNRFSNSRADLNYGHGWLCEGGSNQYSNCYGLNNSQDTTNTYDNWQFASSSGNSSTANCQSGSVTGKRVKYGFNDLVNSATVKNYHVNPYSSGSATAEYINQSSGSGFTFARNALVQLTTNSTTPSVVGVTDVYTVNSNPTTITDFTGAVSDQELNLYCADSNTTIQHNGGAIVLTGGGNIKLLTGRWYRFIKAGGNWRDVTSLLASVSADNGDAAKALQARLSDTTQIWATALGANRAVTLGTTGAITGDKFHIVRKATATGASTLDVGTGPLKSLAVSQWCDVEYDGAAWFLSAFGAL